MEYILSDKKKDECVFCRSLAQPGGTENLIVFRGERAFVILNRYPYTSGHIMIVPTQHAASLELLDAPTRAEMMELTSRSLVVLRLEYRGDGFNVGVNIGEAAGAGVKEHVHMHVVPRWVGDSNFMASLGQARVLPETLEDTYTRIQKAWMRAI
jgi:ATP adenylyltransferase